MSSKPKPNKFAQAMRRPQAQESGGDTTAVEAVTEAPSAAEAKAKTANGSVRPSRKNTKHIGGYFDPAVSKQLRAIAVEEDTSVQALLAESIDMLFHARRKPVIARKVTA